MGQFVDHHTMCDTLNKPVGSIIINFCACTQKLVHALIHTQFHGGQQLMCYYQIAAISRHVTIESHVIGPFIIVQGNPPPFCGWGLVHETNFPHGTCIYMDLISGMESGPTKCEV